MRVTILTLSTVFALVLFGSPVDAQVKFGVQGAVITSIDDLSTITPSAPELSGTFGLGARAVFNLPALPIGVIGQGVYYFPDATDFDLQTYSLAAQLRLSTPVITPYALGGWQWRRTSTAGLSSTENGALVGLGVELNLGVSVFVEAAYEFNEELTGFPDFDTDPIVIKGGIMFGG